MFDGTVQKNTKLRLAAANKFFETTEVGIFTPELIAQESLSTGDIGYIVTNLKDIHQVRVGDTIILEKSPEILYPGYRQVKSMVYASMFPTETVDYLNLKKALEKLYLNDSSLEFSAIHSKALGPGFRVGFLGLLHADVVRERLEREYELDLVLTPPQVEYEYDGHTYKEPIVKMMLVFPQQYTGPVMQLCENYRGTFVTMDNKHQTSVVYEMPMSEMISDFFDRLKSVSSGYASLDWELVRFQDVKADKLNVMLNLDPIEEFSEIVVADRAQEKATQLVKKLKDVIHRQQFEVKIQAQYKGKIIASERISAFRKDVLIKNSKVVGAGDVGRKRKLLDKQKEGKKKMKMVGKVEVSKEAFMKMFNKA
jgi:GTP-binding protein LepA